MRDRETAHTERLLAKRAARAASAAGCALAVALSAGAGSSSAATSAYLAPPHSGNGVTVQWYWQIGGGTLPSMTSGPESTANIWDTDMFEDANGMGSNNEPDGRSSIVSQLHAANKYAVCYIEAGAQQAEPDQSHFASADYTNGSNAETTEMQGWPGEYWYDTLGFAGWTPSHQAYSGSAADQAAAGNIATGMAQRIAGCKAEGQDAIEPDDLDGYTNPSQTGASGGGWGLTQAAAAGYEQWLAYTAHNDGLAIFQKNDPANSAAEVASFDGMVIEECNSFDDPCAGSGGHATPYLSAGKPVLNAEYTQDGETTSKFCPSDVAAGISGALFDVNLAGGTYSPCQTGSGYAYPGPVGGGTTTTTSPTTGLPPTGASAPVNTARPVIAGTALPGNRLTTTAGSWQGSPTSFTYAWQRCKSTCATVNGATKHTYSLGSRDLGYRLVAVVTARNAVGATSASSQPTAAVAKARRAVTARSRAAAPEKRGRSSQLHKGRRSRGTTGARLRIPKVATKYRAQ